MTFTALTLGQWATLFGGVAGVVTLLYMLRLRRRKIQVPFGPLWQQVLQEKQTTSLFRVLKRYLSLLLQLALIILIVTALADPTWTGAGLEHREPRAPEPSHTLLVVDTSASMKAADVEKGRMGQALEAAHRVIDRMQPGEALMVARMGRDVIALTDWSTEREVLHQAVREIRAQDTGTDIQPMMQFARNAVRGLTNAQVVLVSDRELAPPDEQLAKSIKLRLIDVGGPAKTNLAVLDFNVRSHLGNQLSYALYYKIKNYGDQPVKAAVYLYGDDENNARTRADFLAKAPAFEPMVHSLAPGEEKIVEKLGVSFPGSRAALFVGPYKDEKYLDSLAADDVAYAVVPHRKSVKVQVVGPPNLFLQAALMTRANVDVKQVALADYTGPDGYDLTVWSEAKPTEVGPGNHVFVNITEGKLPYTVKGTTKGGKLVVPGRQRKHALMRFVKFVEFESGELMRFKKRKGDVIMARSKGGKAAILAHSDADQRWVAVGFDPVGSQWVGHYSFSIFMVNTVNWFFAEEVKLLRPWSLAERWDVRIPWKGLDRVTVTTPAGDELTALVDGGGTLAYTGTQEGIYEVRHPAPKTDAHRTAVVVAAALKDPQESALQARGEYAAWTAPPLPREELTFTVAGAPLWQLLVLAAIALMLFEWFSYHRRWTV